MAFLLCCFLLKTGSHKHNEHHTLQTNSVVTWLLVLSRRHRMERVYGYQQVLLKHGKVQDRSVLEEWLTKIELSDLDVVIMRYPESTGIGGITKDETWLIVDDLIRWWDSCG